ncbi:cupin domain-containing protein [Streptomyces sp. AcH 505]|uniref:JmjC domain-containing protein n=1 Tax=Streptomyces sp. AcH 505 TaxID=352211 RepID=UPI000ACE51A7
MSLRLLLPEDGVTDLLTTWPDEPRVYERGTTQLDRTVTPDVLGSYIDTGCVPAAEVAVMKAAPALHPGCFMTGGRTDPAKLRKLHEDGYTVRLGNLQRVIPFMAGLAQEIQRETGCSNYAHAFLTPPGTQGLLHHWDQQMAVIVQISGVKRWQLWRPEYHSPMREYQESFRVWQNDYLDKWQSTGPDMEVDLKPGQSLLLPRGWVHNPHALESDERSIHLTFAIRERTPLWLAEQLVASAIEKPEFRQVILPGDIIDAALSEQLAETRQTLIHFLEQISTDAFAKTVRQRALTELDYTT